MLVFFITSCGKRMTLGKLDGEWDATSYTIDGVEQDLVSDPIFLDLRAGNSGTWKKPAPNGGFYANSFFDYLYFAKGKRLKFIYETGYIEEFKITKMKALPPFLSYSDEETAKEEYMILERGNEKFKFVKRWEE